MIILGVDPGTATTGFSFMEFKNNAIRLLDYGCIRTPASLPLAERLQQIAIDLQTLIKQWRPKVAAVEEIFFSKNVKTAISVAHARGVIIQKLFENGIISNKYTPSQIKSQICGDGTADKKQVQKMLKISLSLKHDLKQDDAADAIAVALCHIYSQKSLVPSI